jgi:hypothetical protein
MGEGPIFTEDGRLRLIDAVRRMTRDGAHVEASLLTTFSVNFAFYEDVILRLFERAGSRLNVLMADARQVAAAMADPLRRPRRAGLDYILAPINATGAFHPKILAMLADKKPMLAVGSHNSTEAGFARNLEATVCWGHDGAGVPAEIMADAMTFVTHWLESSPGFDPGTAKLVSDRLRQLCPKVGLGPVDTGARFLGRQQQGRSLLEQFRDIVRGKALRSVVLGPFFDDGLHLVREIQRIWAPSEIIVAVQPRTVSLLGLGAELPGLRFVDAASLSVLGSAGVADAMRWPPYLHAKALAIVTTEGVWLALGSANPSAPAWMSVTTGNAEAVIVLSGIAAVEGYQRLGLEGLAAARELSVAELKEASSRTRDAMRQSEITDAIASPVRMAFADGDRIALPGIDATACRHAVELGEDERLIATAQFFTTPDGAEMILGAEGLGARLVRVNGDTGVLATIVIHSLAKVRAATRHQSAARVLDQLGKLDGLNDDDVDEFFELIDKYLFTESSETTGDRASHSAPPARPQDSAFDVPFGPRGVSLLGARQAGPKGRSIVEFELSEIISALIRDLSEIPVNDGDSPDVDIEDRNPPDAPPTPNVNTGVYGEVDWQRLVAACRRRIGTMLNKLHNRLIDSVTDLDKAVWLFGRMLVILSLVRKLRARLPPDNLQAHRHGRPESLISAEQIRALFKACMSALYRPKGGIASWLEGSKDHRLGQERAMLDALLMWAAREIGADAEAQVPFDESVEHRNKRLGDKADVVVAAMSAAAHPETTYALLSRGGTESIWHDVPALLPDSLGRHMRLGTALQAAASKGRLQTFNIPIKAGDLAVWKSEPGFPRVVASVSSDKTILVGIGDESGEDRKRLKQEAVAAVDVGALFGVAGADGVLYV